jgi:UTP--glucose-1-phosphate uridylyltransferase
MADPAAAGRRAVRAVIPAAGLATRFLPASKAVPKELLPMVDRPVLQYIVEEAVAAGLDDILIVTSQGKNAILDYFDWRPDIEARLAGKGDQERLAAVRRTSELADLHFCRQHEPLGLADAVGAAESHVGDNAFAVLLGDEFLDGDRPLLRSMADLQARTGGIVLGLMEVPPSHTGRYGIATAADCDLGPDVVEVTGLVEKPAPAEAPGNLALIGRFVLPGAIFGAIAKTQPGLADEIHLTDSMILALEAGMPVHGIRYRGRRHDTGVPLGYLQTVVRLAGERPDIGPEFVDWLVGYVADRSTGR